MKLWDRQLDHYPAPAARRVQLGLVVLITVALYYALYVGGGVTPLVMRELHMSFGYLVGTLALANAQGAVGAVVAARAGPFGRAARGGGGRCGAVGGGGLGYPAAWGGVFGSC